jgi:hypothetical protein
MHHERVLEIKRGVALELEALERKRAEIQARMSAGNTTGVLSPEDAAVLDGSARTHLEEQARIEIDEVMRSGSRTRSSGLSGNAEAALGAIDELMVEGHPGGVDRESVASSLGYEEPHLGAALQELKEGDLIAGIEVAQLYGPIKGIRLLPRGREKLAAIQASRAASAASDRRAQTGFLLMPFEPELDWLRDELVGAGRDVGIEIERADDIFEAGVIIEQVKERIKTADVILAVCTGRNANVFYELGIAEHEHKPILVARDSRDLPFDVQHFRAQFYGKDEPDQNRATLRHRVSAAIQQSIEARLPRGRRGGPPPSSAVRPQLDARIYERSRGTYILEVANRGNVPLSEVSWELPSSARNWTVMTAVLPAYPVPILEPGDSVRVPVSVSMGGDAAIGLILRAITPDGDAYERTKPISVWG